MKNTIKKSIITGITFFFTVCFLFISYATVTNIWTDTSTLEVNSGSVLTANSWNKLLGNFESLSGAINSTPIIGSWIQTSERTGLGNFIWDAELLNTDTSSLGWIAGQDYITINKAGYYEINANVLGSALADNQRQDAQMLRNASVIDISLGMGGISQPYYKHILSDISYFNVGDKVYVKITAAGGRYGAGAWSKLTIKKLN